MPDPVEEQSAEPVAETSVATAEPEQSEAVLGDKLDALFSGESTSDPTELTNEDIVTLAKGVAEDKDLASEDDTVGEAEDDVELEDSASAADTETGDAPTMPDAYRRTLKAYGWEDKDIESNLTTLGGDFIRTASLLHTNRNQEMSQWADAGRKARESQGDKAEPAKPLEQFNLDELKDEFGDDEIVTKFGGMMNGLIAQHKAVLEEVQGYRNDAYQADQERAGLRADEFFTQLTGFGGLYGTSDNGITDGELSKRTDVLENAFNLMLGSENLSGTQMPFNDAMQHAHDMVSSSFTQEAVRNGIKKQAKKRHGGLSLKPSNTKKPATGQSRGDFESNVGNQLKAIFTT